MHTDLSTNTMESALAPLGDQLSCEQCRIALQERLKTLVMQWSVVKVRIRPLSQPVYLYNSEDDMTSL